MISLLDALVNGPHDADCLLCGSTATVPARALAAGTVLRGARARLAGRSVLIATRDQLAAALAAIELDGIARRIILYPPDLSSRYLADVAAKGDADTLVTDENAAGVDVDVELRVVCRPQVTPERKTPLPPRRTEWVLLTSGTTASPKLVVHTFDSLRAPIRVRRGDSAAKLAWGTFYDIRRYGGLQIFFRAILGGGSFLMSGPGESIGSYLSRLAAHSVTHISGTPSHWRRALMSGAPHPITPRYVRLSGEIADQGILNALRTRYPHAEISHAFASTEAGVAFEVTDGREGFPATIVGATNDVEIRVDDGSLRIRSPRTAARYLGNEPPLKDRRGFVDTGDVVVSRGDRYFFLGRRAGVINVGGLKVYPEEVEAAINRHPAVRMSMVRPRRSPLIGSLVAADVVLTAAGGIDGDNGDVEREILQICRETLAPFKIPATIRFVAAVEVAAAGKLARHA